MKICAIICEYNPFHNGHLYQLREAKRLSGADAILCVMSGNFVQRGEAAILDKYTRAKHAILAGADIVIELPTAFSTSNAELFAKGAISLLSSIPSVETLCFGAENANKIAFLSAARYLNNEPAEVSLKIKEIVKKGESYAKARAQSWAGFIPLELLCSPNNILGLEYTKAILAKGSSIQILPIERIGSAYNDKKLNEEYSSASAIREAIKKNQGYEMSVPPFVLPDLPNRLENRLDFLEKYAILTRPTEDIAKICDCSEGLENAFKKAAESIASLVETLTSARYTSSRIRRIALQNLLTIEEVFIRECLQAPLYLRVLAAKKGSTELLSELANSPYPIIARAHDKNALSGIAKECYEKDIFAEKIYNLLYDASKQRNLFL